MKNWLLAVLGASALIGILFVYAALAGPPGPREVGESCGAAQDCGFGRVCLVDAEGSICTKGCDSTHDCPAGWTCELARQSGGLGALTKLCMKEP